MVKKVQFEDKIALDSLDNIDQVNKFTDQDANEIKNTINENADLLDQAITNIEENKNYIGQLKEYTDKRIEEISITGVDLSNYYNKQEVDENVNPLIISLTNHENSLSSIQQDQLGQDQKISILENEDTTIKQSIIDLESKVDQNQNQNENYFQELSNSFNQSQNQQDQKISILENEDTTIKQSVTDLSNIVDNVISDLRDFRPFKYIGEFTPGQTYQLNELVSLNNNLYLSNENNNTDTPPTDKWVLLNEEIRIDLSNYYNKQEVDQKVNPLMAKIENHQNQLDQFQQEQTIQNQNIDNLTSSMNQAESQITNHDQQIADLNQNLQTKQDQIQDLNQYAKLNQNQTFTRPNRFNEAISIWKSDNAVKLVQDNNASFYTVEKADGTRRFIAGISSSGSNRGLVWSKEQITISCDQGDLVLESKQANVSANNKRLINIANPTNNQDAATKQYVDSKVLTAGNGISISNNTITNTLYGKTLKIVEKHTEIYKQTFSLNTGKPQRRKLFTWSPKTGTSNAQGYLFYVRLEGRNNNAVSSSIQFRQTHLNDVDYYNVIKMPINDGTNNYKDNGYVTTADFIPFLISDSDVWILDSNADIFGGTLKFIIYETVSYTHLTLPTIQHWCRSRWSPYH